LALASALEAAPGGKLDVTEAEQLVCGLLSMSHVDLDLLLSVLSGFRIERPSLFEAYLTS
jgi:hypothetical protein